MPIIKNISIKTKSADGYSLLQMVIALLVLSVMTTPFLTLYNLQQNQKRIDTTEQNMSNVISAIQNYRLLYGLFPCPAPMKISRTDPAYGHEVGFNDPSALACRDAATQAILPGHCGSGNHDVCVQKADTPRTNELNLSSPGISNRVIIGSVPFRLLQINEKSTIDGYGSKYVYAVTESLTDAAKFKEKNGAIQIVDGSGVTNTDPDASASFTIMSMGPDKAGGITLEGVETAPCPVTGATLDADNCALGFDPGSTYPQIARYRDAYQNTAPGTNHYDDRINYFVNQDDPLWRRTQGDNENIQDLSVQNVGINTAAPPSDIQLDISSPGGTSDSIRLNGTNGIMAFQSSANGRLMADAICDTQNPASCFNPALFGSNKSVHAPTRLECPSGQALIAISGGGPVCEDLAKIAGFQCPPATPLLYSYTDASTYDCRAMPKRCPADTRNLNLCTSGTVNLPVTNALGTYTEYRGSCAMAVYTCRANGTWRASPTISGYCPSSTVISSATSSCAFGYSGSTTTTNTATCTSTTTWTITPSTTSTCTCTGGTRSITQSCAADLGSDFTGTETATQTATPPSCTLSQTPWDKSGCTCVPNSTQSRRCSSDPSFGPDFAGTETRTVTRTMPSCSPVISAWDTSACTCLPNSTQSRACSSDPAFGAYFTGTETRTITRAMPSCTPSTSAWDTSACACLPGSTQTRRCSADPAFGPGYSGTETRTITYSGASCSPATSAWDTSACSCGLSTLTSTAHHTCANPTCEIYNPADDDVFTQTVNASSCSYNVASQTHVGSCIPRSFHWVDQGTIGAPGGAYPPDRVDIGSGCTCAQSAGPPSTSCYDPSDSSRQPHRCACQ